MTGGLLLLLLLCSRLAPVAIIDMGRQMVRSVAFFQAVFVNEETLRVHSSA